MMPPILLAIAVLKYCNNQEGWEEPVSEVFKEIVKVVEQKEKILVTDEAQITNQSEI